MFGSIINIFSAVKVHSFVISDEADFHRMAKIMNFPYQTHCAEEKRGSKLFLFNPFPNKSWLLHVCSVSLLKSLWEKEKLLVTSIFSFSHSVFYSFGEYSTTFIKFEIVVCKRLQFGSLKFVVKLKKTLLEKGKVCYRHFSFTTMFSSAFSLLV